MTLSLSFWFVWHFGLPGLLAFCHWVSLPRRSVSSMCCRHRRAIRETTWTVNWFMERCNSQVAQETIVLGCLACRIKENTWNMTIRIQKYAIMHPNSCCLTHLGPKSSAFSARGANDLSWAMRWKLWHHCNHESDLWPMGLKAWQPEWPEWLIPAKLETYARAYASNMNKQNEQVKTCTNEWTTKWTSLEKEEATSTYTTQTQTKRQADRQTRHNTTHR